MKELIKAIIKLSKQKLLRKKNSDDLFIELTTYNKDYIPKYDKEIFEYFWNN